MRKRREKKSLKYEMNIVPYIDVMFVLLIVFMVTATTIFSSNIEIDLPETTDNPNTLTSEDEELLIVSIDAQGAYYFNLSDNPDQAQTLDEIEKEVRFRLSQQNKLFQVAIRSDKKTPLGNVIDAMSLLKRITHQKVKVMTTLP